jgi:hypothetical protein
MNRASHILDKLEFREFPWADVDLHRRHKGRSTRGDRRQLIQLRPRYSDRWRREILRFRYLQQSKVRSSQDRILKISAVDIRPREIGVGQHGLSKIHTAQIGSRE